MKGDTNISTGCLRNYGTRFEPKNFQQKCQSYDCDYHPVEVTRTFCFLSVILLAVLRPSGSSAM